MVAPRTVVVVNPKSQGGRLGKRWPELADTIGARVPVRRGVTTRARATRRGSRARRCAAGAERIVAIGGDGTINEVVNGFFDDGKPIAPDASFALIPFGTGGDFRRTLELPIEHADAARGDRGEPQRKQIDVGRLELTRADGARAVAHVREHRVVRRVGRRRSAGQRERQEARPAVVRARDRARARGRTRTSASQLMFDGDASRVEATINTVAVANGKYFGGAMMVAPNAELDDGQFDVIAMGDSHVRRSR